LYLPASLGRRWIMKKAYTTPQLTVHGSVEKLTLQAGGFGGGSENKPCAGTDRSGKAGFSECEVISS
jgi:hypothetical protein